MIQMTEDSSPKTMGARKTSITYLCAAKSKERKKRNPDVLKST
jgi:hypothetical protein